MAYSNPSVADFKTRFSRDFPFGLSTSQVMDSDITIAFSDASASININLWGSQASYSAAYLLLSAHFLCTNLQNSSQGISGSYAWLTSSKGVGSVSESYQIPQRILDNPYFAMISKTTYGAKYLMMCLPNICGQVFTMYEQTKA